MIAAYISLVVGKHTLGLSSCEMSAPIGVDPEAGSTDAALGSSVALVTSKCAPSKVPPFSILSSAPLFARLTMTSSSRSAFQTRFPPATHSF